MFVRGLSIETIISKLLKRPWKVDKGREKIRNKY